MATIKICNKCNIGKDISFFSKNLRMKDSLSRTCKECTKQIYLKNFIKIKEYQKNNFEKRKIKRKEYWKKNKERLNAKQKEFYYSNKERLNKISRDYYDNNKDILIEYQKNYRLNNKEGVRKTQRKNYKSRKRNNPLYKIRVHCSRSVYSFLKRNGTSKRGASFWKYVPYTLADLKDHIEKQFEPWMSWDNWGKLSKSWDDNDSSTWTWQIDHIIPHSTFKYTSMEDQSFKDCWALDNLRPLSSKINFLDGVNKTRHM